MKRTLLFLILLALVPVLGPPAGQQGDRSRLGLDNVAAAAEPDKKEVTVYVTRTGTKYHREGCRYLAKSSIPISLSEAAKRYEPCKVCKPPRLDDNQTTSDPPDATATAPDPAKGPAAPAEELAAAPSAPTADAADEKAQEDNIAVYFSPKGGCTAAIVKELDQAKETVLVQAYSFTSTAIAKALVDAHKRGVKITVVLDKSNRTKNYSAADFVAHAEIPCYIDAQHAIAHNKVMLIDGKTIITGSFNFTKAAENSNAENLLVIHDHPKLYAAYEENFQKHLGHSEPYTGK